MPTFSCRLRYNLAAFILITTVSSAFAEAAEHADRPPTRVAQADTVAFEIPPQDLQTALTAFAEASGWQLFYSAETTEDRRTAGLSGRYTPEEGLRLLLAGTAVDYRMTGPRSVTLIRKENLVAPTAATDATQTVPDPATTSADKPIKVQEILIKEARERDTATSYVAPDTRTATKTDIPLVETPQSISVVTRKRMIDQEVNTLAEALRYMPGVQAEPVGFEPRFTFLRFRGFDATEQGLFKDGLQLRNPGFAVSYNLEPYGAEQIDVLRGPASFLYGQGSPGGLLNYISKRPTQHSLHELQFLTGSFGRHEGRFDFGGRLNDSDLFSYRLTGLFRESGTQIDNVPNDRVYIAPALTWRIAPSTAATFFAVYQKDRLGFSQAFPFEGTLRTTPFGTVSPHRFAGQPSTDKYNRREHSVGYELSHSFTDSWRFLQKFRYNSTELDDVSTFGFPQGSALPTLDRAQQAVFGKLNAVTLDNQLTGAFATGPLHHLLLTGVDFQRLHIRSRQDFALASSINVFERYDYGALGTIPLPFLSLNQETTQLQTGVYVQDQVKYDRWLLTLGGRHDWARNETTDNLTGIRSPQDDSKSTGRAALTYVFDIGLAPYISYSTFFLPSIVLDASGNAFKPETGRQYEAGVKYQAPGSRSFVTVAVFDLTRENLVQLDPSTNLRVQRGKVRSRGLELEGVASFDSGVDLIAAYTLLDNDVRETSNPVEKGNRLTQTPAQFGSLWGRYTVLQGSLKGLGFGAGARYTGNTYADEANTFKVPGFVVGDAMLDYTWRQYRFALNVTNIFNHDAFSCFDRGGTNFCAYGEQRTVVGSVAYRW
ncbi:TonB-dependent siderophore receptor [Nitrospira moscoviensis]|uniref:TonB-dependent siderophore receptor n=1 Tax=Nitrospira moscoviensis TaxID=42253 RepID=A0A0K2G8L9_NITMO|nr:TonB-dependent siderophore receptor [Nitrospira moscoviensis]ALA57321.1 TonB-dependent siderophore receptor [Nitrospira moscoviensis]